MTERSTARQLLVAAASTPVEVVEINVHDGAPDGAIEMMLRIPEDDVETSALAMIYALGVLSFSEARPAGVSDMHFEHDDEWSVADMVGHLRFPRGRLEFEADYVRGRLMKTSIDVAPDGAIRLAVFKRGQTARRWIAMLQGRRPLAVVDSAPESVFYAPSGHRLAKLEDWQAVHPAKHWKTGRSAMLLAQSWGGAAGIPEVVAAALDKQERLRDLSLDIAFVEHKTSAPSRGGASQTDILVCASDPLGNDVVIAVEGKVDEGFAQPVATWLALGKSANSPKNRRMRVDDMLIDLCIDPRDPGVDSLAYQLLHRSWAGLREAMDRGVTRAVFLVHSFMAPGEKGSGWSDFKHFASLLVPDGDAPEVDVPYRLQVIDGVECWLLWVADSAG